MRYTIKDFEQRFPDNDACLQYMFDQLHSNMVACPKCGVTEPKYYRVRSKKVYECKDCGNQVSPLANTIFHKSETPLRSWFWVLFMFSVSKNGVSAKEIERTLGVTYKTAWRMAKLVRSCGKAATSSPALLKSMRHTWAAGQTQPVGSLTKPL